MAGLVRWIAMRQIAPRITGGSLAHGTADFYSDVDLYVVVQDEAFGEIFAERGVTVEAVGSPLFAFDVDPMPGGSTDHIVIYKGPVKFDLMYLKKSDLKPDPKWASCTVLKDASGRVGAVVARSEGLAPPQPTTEELLDLVLVCLRQDRAGRAVGSAGRHP
jgi:hypothetical protein